MKSLTMSVLVVMAAAQEHASLLKKHDLPELFSYNHGSHSVAVYRGAALKAAIAAGIVKGFGKAPSLPRESRRLDVVDECATNNGGCLNGARCNGDAVTGKATCSCPAGFTGQFCESDIDECRASSGPVCMNGGQCVNTLGSFQCRCPVGWTGQRCEVDINECAAANGSSLCQNGGQCMNTPGSFQCRCPAGFSGRRCEVAPEPTCGCVSSGMSSQLKRMQRQVAELQASLAAMAPELMDLPMCA